MKLQVIDTETRHDYFLDGRKCSGVTTLAKAPDNTWGLDRWNERMVAIGVASRPDLVESIAAHVDDKEKMNEFCGLAKEEAKANRGSRRGTAAHRVTERVDAGEEVIATPLATTVAADWTAIMDAAGLEVIPEYMERVVVYPHLHLAGKFDRIARTRKGRLVIVDLKTGQNAVDYPHAIAVQLALYANAPLMAGVLDLHGETTEFGPLPDVDKRWGVVIHLPEDGAPRAVKIDIEAGWETAQKICFPILKWRKVRPNQLVFPLAELTPKPEWTVDEGPELPPADVNALRLAFKQCPGKAACDAWLKQSIDAGRSFHPARPHGRPTQRRIAIIRAAMAWSEFDEDIVRAGLGLILQLEPQTTQSVGGLLGSLTIEEAMRFEHLAGTVSVNFRDDGSPIVAVA